MQQLQQHSGGQCGGFHLPLEMLHSHMMMVELRPIQQVEAASGSAALESSGLR